MGQDEQEEIGGCVRFILGSFPSRSGFCRRRFLSADDVTGEAKERSPRSPPFKGTKRVNAGMVH